MHPLLQDYLASVQHSTALEQAHQLAQQALQQQIEDLHSSHAQAMAREQQLREAAAQVGPVTRVCLPCILGTAAFVAEGSVIGGSVRMHSALPSSCNLRAG